MHESRGVSLTLSKRVGAVGTLRHDRQQSNYCKAEHKRGEELAPQAGEFGRARLPGSWALALEASLGATEGVRDYGVLGLSV